MLIYIDQKNEIIPQRCHLILPVSHLEQTGKGEVFPAKQMIDHFQQFFEGNEIKSKYINNK